MAANHSLSEYLLRRSGWLKLVGWLAARNPSSVHPQYLWGNRRCPGAAGWCPHCSHSALPRAGRPRWTPDMRESDTASSAPWRSCACRRETGFDCMVFRAEWCTDASANSVFSCPITHLLSMLYIFMTSLSHASAKRKEKKKGYGFQISHFCLSFSSDIVAVKGLIK